MGVLVVEVATAEMFQKVLQLVVTSVVIEVTAFLAVVVLVIVL